MNCAKCSQPRGRRNAVELRLAVDVRLLKVGIVGDSDKFKCPRCRAIFFFPTSNARQQTFNQTLALA
jgi:hypothetical protein